jgi:hypothetical protein
MREFGRHSPVANTSGPKEALSGNLKDFFSRYESAFTSSNVGAIAKVFADMCLITTPEEVLLVRNDNELRTILNGISSRYRAIGVRSVKIASFTEIELDPYHALAKVQWSLHRNDGTEIVSFDVTYPARMTEDGPEIILLIPHNEEERLREKGLFAPSRGAGSP